LHPWWPPQPKLNLAKTLLKTAQNKLCLKKNFSPKNSIDLLRYFGYFPAMGLGKWAFGITAVLGIYTSDCFAAIEGELQTQLFKYAPDHSPTFYLSDKTIFSTGDFLGQANIYLETGPQGSWSFDPDPIRFSFYLDDHKQSLIFLGRDHPLNFTRGFAVEPYTALGSIWAQNQLEALNPRVSGWIGAGIVQALSPSLKLTAMYSPLFLPTFGPSLGFTDRGELNPARFTRLPPENATTGGVTVPIRYQIQINQLADLLLQHQAFLGLNFNNPDVNFDVYAYTAPDPNVVPLTNAKLAVNADTVNAKVTIDPQFPREYWSGMRLFFKKLPFTPALEFVQSLIDYPTHIVSLTGYFDTSEFNPFVAKHQARSAFGVLSHFQRQFADPNLSDCLLFVKIPIAITDSLTYENLLETTMLSMRQSFYWLNQLEYEFHQGFSALVAIRILTGQDHSYFGDWRDQDSFSSGVKWGW